MKTQIYKNAVIFDFDWLSPHGVFDENGQNVASYSCYKSEQNYKEFYKGEILQDERDVIFLGCIYGHYGHLITEEMSRLWWVLENGANGKLFAYSSINNTPLNKVALRLLDKFGVRSEQLVHVKKPTRFKSVTLVECGWKERDGKFELDENYKRINEQILKDVTPVKNEAIYLSRTKTNKSGDLGFGEIYYERHFEKLGYKVVHPQNFSFDEQLALYAGCAKFACVSGTLPHNLLFAPNGSEVTIIKKESSQNRYQQAINEFKQLKVSEIDECLELCGVDMGRGPFLFLPRVCEDKSGYKEAILGFLSQYQKAFGHP